MTQRNQNSIIIVAAALAVVITAGLCPLQS